MARNKRKIIFLVKIMMGGSLVRNSNKKNVNHLTNSYYKKVKTSDTVYLLRSVLSYNVNKGEDRIIFNKSEVATKNYLLTFILTLKKYTFVNPFQQRRYSRIQNVRPSETVREKRECLGCNSIQMGEILVQISFTNEHLVYNIFGRVVCQSFYKRHTCIFLK